MKVLVSGGAGYIGSHTVVRLVEAGHDVVVVDNFSNAVPAVLGRLEALTGTSIPNHAFDLVDHDKTAHLFESEGFDAVIHFAGYKAVGESVEKPLDYYENNLGSTFSLLRAMERHDVHKLVFSSSATVYGTDQAGATEDRRTFATNPYGWTKVMQEQILRDVAVAAPQMRFALLRYFNPVGAHPSGTIGENPSGTPNNLMPYIAQVAVGKREKLQVFGDDYDTPDGTGVRDYIHVMDLAEGHVAALEALEPGVLTVNLGTGVGGSVLDVLRAFERVVGRELPVEVVERRPGDAPVSTADPTFARERLGWQASRTLDDAVTDAWRWQQRNPRGYRG